MINKKSELSLSINWKEETEVLLTEVEKVPIELKKFVKLKKLKLKGQSISELPAWIGELTTLENLDVSETGIRELPKSMAELKKLNFLNISCTAIYRLPNWISELTNIQSLDITNTAIDELPDWISGLNNLQNLHIRGTRICRLPRWISGLTNLQSLSIANKNTYELHDWMAKLTKLQKLDISGSGIRELPDWISELVNLRSLDISNTAIRELPRCILKLSNLQNLFINNTRICEFPDWMSQLSNLQVLNIANTNICELPHWMAGLNNLQTLNISHTGITLLSEDIVNLPNLKDLQLEKLIITNIPHVVIMGGLVDIRNYMTLLRAKLYEAKLILVGRGGVGKTSLVKKIISNELPIIENEEMTQGIDIQPWIVPVKIDSVEHQFRINVWDFSGQEIMHSTHQFFLTQKSLYLFVWEAREEDHRTDFDYWLNIVSLLSDNSPIMVIQNKLDVNYQEIDQIELKKSFPNIVGFYQVSAKNGSGITDLSAEIKRQICNLQHIGEEWPEIWTNIRKVLESDTREVIGYKEYIEICRYFNLNEEQSRSLSRSLHFLGVILHFEQDPLLQNIVILKPEWATKAVYALLNDEVLKQQNGSFCLENIKKIWEVYAQEKHSYLLQLMVKFELCFKIRGRINENDLYIIPQLLKYDRPIFQWNSQENLRFEYEYKFMPAGIVTRFIVRNHQCVEEKNYWREGVILSEENTRALITSHPYERKIKIAICGYSKREMLGNIRKDIKSIHSLLNCSAVEERIACVCSECSDSNNPHYFKYETLKKYLEKEKNDIICENSVETVEVRKIVGDLIAKTNERTSIKEINFMFDQSRIINNGQFNQGAGTWVKGDNPGSITQAGDNSMVTVSYSNHQYTIEELSEIWKELKEILEQTSFVSNDDKEDIEASIGGIDLQFQVSKPKPAIISECFKSIRSIVEGTTGSLVATSLPELLPKMNDFYTVFKHIFHGSI